jgi:hypothetical protein
VLVTRIPILARYSGKKIVSSIVLLLREQDDKVLGTLNDFDAADEVDIKTVSSKDIKILDVDLAQLNSLTCIRQYFDFSLFEQTFNVQHGRSCVAAHRQFEEYRNICIPEDKSIRTVHDLAI